MEIWCIKGMYRLKPVSGEKIQGLKVTREAAAQFILQPQYTDNPLNICEGIITNALQICSKELSCLQCNQMRELQWGVALCSKSNTKSESLQFVWNYPVHLFMYSHSTGVGSCVEAMPCHAKCSWQFKNVRSSYRYHICQQCSNFSSQSSYCSYI